jgi:hypothetical protein
MSLASSWQLSCLRPLAKSEGDGGGVGEIPGIPITYFLPAFG